jgi:hypothetical protein
MQRKTEQNLQYTPNHKTILLVLLILAADIEVNLGPQYQCNVCKKRVKRNDNAIQYDSCDLWVHARCENISKKDYDRLVKAEQSDWFCTNCSAQCYLFNKQVKPNDPAVQCDNCNNWIHNKCPGITSEEYKELQTSSATWICPTYDIMNFSDSFFANSNSI